MSGPAAGGATAGSAAHTADVALSQSDCPYRGLRAYTDLDSEFFFGREADTDLVVANLLSSRVTVLCGPSGVGKSSLLQAGVLRELRHVSEGAFSFLAADQVIAVYFASWRDDPLWDLGRAIGEALPDGPLRAEMLADRRELSVELVERIVDEYDADVYLLLDQLEELDLYQKGAAGDAIAAVLGAVIRAPRLRASVLLGIREDALAKLDRLERHVPGILNSYLRLDHLSEDGAREAIAGPLVRYNELRPPDQHVRIEPALVDALLVELRTGQVAVADAGTGVVDDDDATIETPFLQLVMTRLRAHDIGPDRPDRADRDGANGAGGARVLRAATLTELGGAQNIVRTHLDEVMSELTDPQREVAAQVFRHLVTPSGTKIAHSAADLADYAGVADLDVLTELLERLASGRHRVLRPVAPPVDHPGPTRYEIFHDVMAPAILDWRRRYVAQRDRDAAERTLVEAKEAAEAKNRETRRKLRRSRLFSGVLVALLAITVVLGILVVQQRQASARADDQRRQADVSAALQGIESDPAASLHTALTAWEADPDSQVEDLLRRALDADGNRLTITTDAGSASSAEFSPDGSTLLAAGTDGRTTLYHAATGSVLGDLPLAEGQIPAIILWAGFSPQGSMVATLADDGTITVYDAATRQIVSTPDYGADTSVIKWGTHDDREVLTRFGPGRAARAVGPPGRRTRGQLRGLRGPPVRRRRAPRGRRARGRGVPTKGRLRVEAGDLGCRHRPRDRYQSGRDVPGPLPALRLADLRRGRLRGPAHRGGQLPGHPLVGDHGTDHRHRRVSPGHRRRRSCGPRITGDDSSNEAADEPTVGPTSDGEATGAGTIEAPLVSQLDFAPAVSEDNRLIAYVVGKWIALLDATTLTQVGSIPQQDEFVSDMAFSPDGSLIATALEDGSLTVWRGDSWNNQPVARLLGHQSTIYDVRFSAADPTQLVTAGADGTTRTWQLPERTVLTASGGWMPDADLNAAADAVVTADQFGHWWLLDENLDAVQDEYLGSTDRCSTSTWQRTAGASLR